MQAEIHNIDPQKKSPQQNGVENSSHCINWKKYAELSTIECPEISDDLFRNLNLLEKVSQELDDATKNLPNINCICNEDMDPKNVMWHNGNAYIIDLECLNRGNPISHAFQLSLQWAGITTCKLSEENLKAFWNGYLSTAKFKEFNPRDIFGIVFTWIEWLEYNIKRALKIECNDRAEQKMGIEQTKMTINRIYYINQRKEKIIRIIEEIIGENQK